MSASAIVTFAVLVIVAVILVREHRREARPRGSLQAAATSHTEPELADSEVEKILNSFDAQLEAHRLDYINLRPVAALAPSPWNSKFGGKAYWPRTARYPEAENGHKLYLLAQLNFSELPALPGYPERGLLQFFITDDDLMGLSFADSSGKQAELRKNPGNFRVVYHEEILEDPGALETEVPDTGEAEYFPLSAEYALKAERKSGLPSSTDYRFEQTGIDLTAMPDQVMDALWERNDAAGSRIGGYATFTQDDPRYGQPQDAWLLLFQMDTSYEDTVDIMWGDCGVGNFFIQPDALAKRDFSRVWYNWDCC
ncbi:MULTISPECIES: YwqG family protein [unclassified Microbulbifer]|uniref:YwqG family protein n=1 Tax=unclassified Microbulbifer TaxID=2619833 RepID=UPI0027E3B546|nr:MULTISPECIES: YwqG family protein [unclassified Microbulbifer]